MIYLLLYIYDMLIACQDKREIDYLKGLLSSEFEMKDLGVTRKLLRMEIVRNREKKTRLLTQQNYLKKVLLRFGMCCTISYAIGVNVQMYTTSNIMMSI